MRQTRTEEILSAAYPEGQGDISFAADLLTALWERDFTHIDFKIQDQLSPAAVGAQTDSSLSPVAERIQALMGQKMRDEIAAGINVGSKGSVAKLASAILTRQASNLGMALGGDAAFRRPDAAHGRRLAD